jgi:hypothetical protein
MRSTRSAGSAKLAGLGLGLRDLVQVFGYTASPASPAASQHTQPEQPTNPQPCAQTLLPGAHHPASPRPPISAPAITDDASRSALRSTRNRPRRAVRRGASTAGGATEQLSGSAAGSLARWQVASPASRHVCQAPRAAHRYTVCCPSGVVVPACPDADRALVALAASARPVSSAQCPVPGVRVRTGVRCERPASASPLSAPVSSWSAGAVAATRLGTGRVGVTYLTHGSLSPD